jgi:hypothetical protein
VQAEPLEDPRVRLVVLLVALVEPGPVAVERVRVFHHELADTDEAAPGTGLVAELRLEVIDDHRQLAIAAHQVAREVGDDLLVRHRDHGIATGAVLEADHLGPDLLVATRLAPQLGRMDDGHLHLLAADPVDLLADDLFHPLRHAEAQRQQRVQPRAQLADVPGAQQQPMRRHLRLGRIVAKRGEEQVGETHRGRIAACIGRSPERIDGGGTRVGSVPIVATDVTGRRVARYRASHRPHPCAPHAHLT